MKEQKYVIFCGRVIGLLADDSIGIFDSVSEYQQAYNRHRKQLEDELADYLFMLDNEYEMDDLQNDHLEVTA